MSNKAFLLPYPERSQGRGWVHELIGTMTVWVQSPNGTFMLLAGGWATERSAKQFCKDAGYELIDPDKGLRMLEQQMSVRFDQHTETPRVH